MGRCILNFSLISFQLVLLCFFYNNMIIVTYQLSLNPVGGGANQVTGYGFVLHWPPAVCSADPTLCNNLVSRFTVHGLWPYDINYDSLYNCKGSQFDISLLSPVQSKLDYIWPSYGINPNSKFWEHEWDHHGKCSESLLPQADYFSKSVSFYEYHDLLATFKSKGIQPNGQFYKVQDIVNAFPAYKIQVRCKNNSAGEALLHEIVTCIDLNDRYTNCGKPSSCPARIKFLA